MIFISFSQRHRGAEKINNEDVFTPISSPCLCVSVRVLLLVNNK